MVTIRDVAALAGVPEKTAARALAGLTMGKRRDAKERAERAIKAAAELGYQPSEIAKALRKGKTMTVGLLVGSITNKFFAAVAETAMDEAEKLGYRLVLELTRWNEERSIDALEHLQRLRVEGIFYASGFFPQEWPVLQKLRSNNYPIIMLQRNTLGIPSVHQDHSCALPAAVEMLAARGHRTIDIVIWQTRTKYDEDVAEIFQHACAKQDVTPVVHRSLSGDDVLSLAERQPAALISSGPYSLKYFLGEAKKQTDYRPEVIGIYDEWTFLDRPEGLSGAIIFPGEKQVRLAVRELVSQIEQHLTPGSLSLQSKFYLSDQFDTIQGEDLSFKHLISF